MARRVLSFLLLLVFALASCRTWVPLDGIPDPVPSEMRVQLVSGERAELKEVQRQGDDLVGRVATTSDLVRVPLAEVLHVELLRFSGARTAVLALGVAVVLGIAIASYSLDIDLAPREGSSGR